MTGAAVPPTKSGQPGSNDSRDGLYDAIALVEASARDDFEAVVVLGRCADDECAPAQALDASVNSATTVGQFASSVGGWEARLTAISHTPMTGVPQSRNTARLIAVDYAEANFPLSLAAIHDDPFGRHFSAGAVKRGYSLALRKLQDVLNSCAAAGQGGG